MRARGINEVAITKYKAPDSEAAAFLAQDTYKQIAAQVGESGPELCESLARYYVARISASLRSLRRQGLGQSREARELKQQRAFLSEEPTAVFLYTQRIIDDRFGHLTNCFETWLKNNQPALAMIDRAHLINLLGDAAGLGGYPTWRLFVAAARTMQVVSPFGDGFNASAPKPGARVLEIGAGIYDGISVAAKLIVGATVRFIPGKGLRLRNLRERPALFQKLTDQLKLVLEHAQGKQIELQFSLPRDGPSVQLANELQWGAEAFVILHELAHALLPALPDQHEEEHKSDEFAALTIAGSYNPGLMAGMGLGLFMLITILRQTNKHRITDTHPSISRRYNRLMRSANQSSARIGPFFDALLTAPNRLVEEQAFRVETAPAIRANFAIRLVDAWWKVRRAKAAASVASAIVDRGLRLPTLSESTAHTLWTREESGQRSMALVVDLPSAIDCARIVLAEEGGTDADADAELAAEATLRLIAMLNYSRVPPLSATRILNGLTYQGAKTPPADAQCQEGLSYLAELGCIRPKNRSFELQPNVEITFYADPRGF